MHNLKKAFFEDFEIEQGTSFFINDKKLSTSFDQETVACSTEN